MVLRLQQGLQQDEVTGLVSQVCRGLQVPKRTVYYRSIKSQPKVQESLASPIKEMFEVEPSFGYRTVAHLLGLNKNTVQQIFELRGLRVRKRSVGHRLRIGAAPQACAGRDSWQTLTLRLTAMPG